MEAPKKTGFWTEHVDPKSGRSYYYNMALGRSYWELPSELKAQVKTPTLNALREWDPETAERKYGAAKDFLGADDEEIRKRREVALAKSRTETLEAQAASIKLSLEERMASIAQKRKAMEVQTSEPRQLNPNAESSNEYLKLVRQLQQNNDSEEGTGGIVVVDELLRKMEALQDKKVEFFSMEIMKKNEKAVEYIHTSMCVIAGCMAGILGMTGLQGFAFLAAIYVATAISIWVIKLGMDVKVYFNTSVLSFIVGGVLSQALSFILFWTLSYGLVHIY